MNNNTNVSAIIKAWGKAGIEIVDIAKTMEPFNGNFDDFLDICEVSGNLNGMILTGIRKISEDIYNLIPDHMGKTGNEAFDILCSLVKVLGINV